MSNPPFSGDSCDLLEKSYFCSIANNKNFLAACSLSVVICLKNRTFAVSQTTAEHCAPPLSCCDLLEKSYFCSIANNLRNIVPTIILVVICLKNRTFAVSQTTANNISSFWSKLWFAWKIVLLQYRKQPKWLSLLLWEGCDLLEKSYFCSIANNQSDCHYYCEKVVICLKNRTFAVSQTTKTGEARRKNCCDLLEKSYFCSIANNQVWYFTYRNVVVICLKNRTFAVSQTT